MSRYAEPISQEPLQRSVTGKKSISVAVRLLSSALDDEKQVNPFFPCMNVDGEPHVFGDRVYIYGSHDKEGGETFCMLDYTTYSAPVTDLSADDLSCRPGSGTQLLRMLAQ